MTHYLLEQDRQVWIAGFFHCECGKLHATGLIFWNTVCPTCGRGLFRQMTGSTCR